MTEQDIDIRFKYTYSYIAHACECYEPLLEALRQISTILEGSKAQMENQIQFARSTAKEAIRKAEEQSQ